MSLSTPAPASIRILGIDPGLQTTGFGVIDITGSRLQYVASGVIETTRGDRLFIGLLSAAYVNLIFVGISGKLAQFGSRLLVPVSDAMLQRGLDSSTTTRRPVRSTLSRIVSSSKGEVVRGSEPSIATLPGRSRS